MEGDSDPWRQSRQSAACSQAKQLLESLHLRLSLGVLEGEHPRLSGTLTCNANHCHPTTKTFLLSGQAESWQRALYDGRKLYEDHRDRLLKFIKHPEALAELTIDPLADDPDVSSSAPLGYLFAV